MPKRNEASDEAVLIVKLQKGLAERQRLPLDHVLRVLDEVRQMVADAGRQVQRDMGMERPTAEFGLEILAGSGGVLFRKGSVQAQIAVTSNVQAGLLAAHRVVDTIKSLETRHYTPDGETDRTIVRRLNRIAKIQETDKTEMQFSLRRPGGKQPIAAIFGEAAVATAISLQAPVFQMQDTTVTGKLYELKTDTSDEEEKGFWGELRRDNGETWRVQFAQERKRDVAALFSEQVQITGTAKYYRIATPKLIVKTITPDTERDYESAFDELYGTDKKAFPEGFAEALREMRGDDE
ncbi:MAG TPA: hypothetical protein VHZ25_17255 [Acidobacteriaceae bacterium]|nr:hypothetical protein [Acidobacteriaceae bacterium]